MARNSEYQKGYAAGRRSRDNDRFDRFYAAAMTGLLAGGAWKRGEKVDSSPREYARTARDIAEAMMTVKP